MERTLLSVFVVEPRRIGGVEMFVRELSRRLDYAGWRSVAAFASEPAPAVRDFLGLPNLTLEVVRGAKQPGPRSMLDLRALIRRHRPSVAHFYFTGMLGPFPWWARLSGVPRVFFTDQSSRPEGFIPLRQALWKRAAGRAITSALERVVCISDYTARCDATCGYLAPGKAVRIYNAIDLSRPAGDGGAFRLRFGIAPDQPLVVQVSSMIREKGVGDLIEAAPYVLAAHPRTHFVLAGDGADRAEFERRAAALGVAASVTWTGMLADPLAEGIYDAADVVCQVSRWEEAFGWVIAEAMSRRRAVVATRTGGIPELVEHGHTGLLVERGNPEAIANALGTLLGDVPMRERMGSAGRAAVERNFNLERNVAELLKLYGIHR